MIQNLKKILIPELEDLKKFKRILHTIGKINKMKSWKIY